VPRVNRKQDTKLVKNITDGNSMGVRTRGQPNNIWTGKVLDVLRTLKGGVGGEEDEGGGGEEEDSPS
jgi:hypothetical protein